jgi:hypothetical protein
MRQADGRSPLIGAITIAPAQQSHHDRLEGGALGGQPVFMPCRAFQIAPFDEEARLRQLLQAAGDDPAGNAESLLKNLETPDAKKAVPQDQEGPAVPHHGDGTGD